MAVWHVHAVYKSTPCLRVSVYKYITRVYIGKKRKKYEKRRRLVHESTGGPYPLTSHPLPRKNWGPEIPSTLRYPGTLTWYPGNFFCVYCVYFVYVVYVRIREILHYLCSCTRYTFLCTVLYVYTVPCTQVYQGDLLYILVVY